MFRLLYTLTVVALIGSTAWAATGMKYDRAKAGGRLGIVLLVALQR